MYARLTGQQAAAQYANPEAIRYLSRALELTPASDGVARYELIQLREKVYDLQGARQEQRADLDALAALADALGDDRRRAETMLRQSVLADHLGAPAAATTAAQQCIELAHTAGQSDIEAAAYQWWGLILYAQGHTAARTPLERALTLARRA